MRNDIRAQVMFGLRQTVVHQFSGYTKKKRQRRALPFLFEDDL
jgi:hypothetical protein